MHLSEEHILHGQSNSQVHKPVVTTLTTSKATSGVRDLKT